MNIRKCIEFLPESLQRLSAMASSSIYVRERYGLIDRQWQAYGMISAARYAKSLRLKGFSCFEFGVASGNGLINMVSIAQMIKNEMGVDIRCYGFDTGKGLTKVVDYRDHPEKWKEGDYVMPDPEKLRHKIKGKGELILGDIQETLPTFMKAFDQNYPVGFVSFDVDLYSSTKASLNIFDFNESNYLPIVYCYFDDCFGSTTANKFCGELLAIDEFNQEHSDRKIDIDRSVKVKHKFITYQEYFDKMYIAHFFNHPKRASQHVEHKVV